MSKHIKTTRVRPDCSPKHANWKRRERRKALKVKFIAQREYMAGWVDRSPTEARI